MSATAVATQAAPTPQLSQPEQPAPVPATQPQAAAVTPQPIYGAPILSYSDRRLYGFTLTRPFRACYYEWVKPLTNPYHPILRNPVLEFLRRLVPAIIGMLGMILFAPFALIGRIVQCVHFSTHSIEELARPKFIVSEGEEPIETFLPELQDLVYVFASSVQTAEILRKNFFDQAFYPVRDNEVMMEIMVNYKQLAAQCASPNKPFEQISDKEKALLLRNGFLTLSARDKDNNAITIPLDSSCIEFADVTVVVKLRPRPDEGEAQALAAVDSSDEENGDNT